MADPVTLAITMAANMAASYVVNALFAPKPPNQEGPRLNDRKLQSSTYGNAIPLVYGTYRIAGTSRICTINQTIFLPQTLPQF